MKSQMTSEEKLLRLIRKKKNPGGSKEQASDDSEGKKDKKGSEAKIDNNFFRVGNRILLIVCLAIAVWLGRKYLQGKEGTTDAFIPEVVSGGSKETKDLSVNEPGNFDALRSKLEARDLFQAPWEVPREERGEVAGNVDLKKQLKVVGIVMDGAESKVIVENLQLKETQFLSKGEWVGDAQVEEILEDKVIFNYDDEKIELSP